MQSKQVLGVTTNNKDELEQAVEDAESERYTAAQKAKIQNFVQKANNTNITSSTKVATKTTPKTTVSKTGMATVDTLERQAKQATYERPVYAQKKSAVKMTAEAKKAAKIKRREMLKQKRIQNEKQIAFLKQEEKELAEKEAKIEKDSKIEIDQLKKKESSETKTLSE
jgi:hypothetical protein